MRMIKVLVADDSSVVRELLKDWLKLETDLEIVALAKDGEEAFQLTKNLKPDLIIMDIMMPRMSGIEATENIMAYCPTPILIFSSVVNEEETDISFEAISRGALDVMAKPGENNKAPEHRIREELIKKIRLLSRIPVLPHPLAKLRDREKQRKAKKLIPQGITFLPSDYKILGIGASTGGPKALSEVLRAFPENFPSPILIVQHIAEAFIDGLARWLNRESKISVKIAQAGEMVKPGIAYLGPPERHLSVKSAKIELSADPPVNNCRPSVDVLFQSLAENYGPKSVAVLLTGMGSDGAKGMKAIYDKGGKTIAQDETSSIVFGMPGSAVKLRAVNELKPLAKIPEAIFNTFGLKPERSR